MADQWAEFADAPTAEAHEADPWAEFDDAPKSKTKAKLKADDLPARERKAILTLTPTGEVYDGDTFRLEGGALARLSGVDAFELKQTGRNRAGGEVPLGFLARSYLGGRTSPDDRVEDTGTRSYNRPVVMLRDGGEDVGRASAEAGLSVPTPEYLRNDPERLRQYVDTQRDAIAAERGAYAGEYQRPDEYRHLGAAAPMRGKIPMTAQQSREYLGLLHDPKTTEADLSEWIRAQGHSATNVSNILAFIRRNPNAKAATHFQQQDVQDEAVLPDGPGIVTRTLGALNEGIPDTLGAPVDIVNAGMGAIGLPVSDRPLLGSEMIREGMNSIGIGQVDEGYAPRSTPEAYLQSAARGVGQTVVPLGGTLAAGGRLALEAAPAARGAIRQSLRSLATEAAAHPGVALAGEAGAGVGAGVGGQAARDAFPGNEWADLAGQVVGGALGGLGGGLGASRARRAPRLPDAAPETPAPSLSRVADDWSEFDDAQPVDRAPGGPAAMNNEIEAVSISARVPDHGDPWSEFQDAAPQAAGAASGPHGPIYTDLAADYPAAVAKLAADRAGEVPGAISHPEIGPIDLVWGNGDYGLSKIMAKHPEVVDALPEIVSSLPVRQRPAETGNNRFVLEDERYRAVVAPDFNGDPKRWLVTAFERKGAPGGQTSRRAPPLPDGGSTGAELSPDIGQSQPLGNESGLLRRARPLSDRPSPEEIADLARTVNPEDVTPLPANAIESLDEAVRANPGSVQDVVAPNERDALPSYRLKEGAPARKDPIDLIGWLRTKGGIRDHRGELASLGIDNAPRSIEFAKSEGFLGKLIDQRQGMGLDDAAHAAWEAGFFPDHAEQPTVAEFLNALGETHRGGAGRVYHPDDYATLDAFNAARAQRGAVETAAQEGSPLAENVGRPIGMADLDANQPPATAYEDLPSVGGKAGNIALGKLETRGDIRRALMNTDAKVGGFDAARRGKMSQAETEALAREMGMTADDLLKRGQGQALNAEQALAARSILAKSADELVTLASKVQGGSDADMAAFRQAWIRHVAIQEQVSGATAEAGRALAQFKMAGKSKLAQGRIHRAIIDSGGGEDRLEEAAQAILDSKDDPSLLNQTARLALKPKLKDKLIELYYNSLLSGPQTHAVNILSNAMTAGLQIPEHAAAAVIGGARRMAMLGKGNPDRVLLTEVGARAVGLMQGTREGLRAFARTARTGVVPDHVSKVEAQTQEAISGLKGKIIRTPTRLLSAEDELFKAIGRRMEISGLAVRQARLEGLKGEALRKRIVDLTANPTDDMTEKSLDYARYVTFQRPLGKLGNLMTAATQEFPLLKLIVPFVRTPTNILKFAVERSPAAPIMKEVRADLAAGGSRRDLAVAKIALGSGLGALATQWAADGTITGGGPADKGAKSLMLADGWQPYSVRIGDKYYSYQRFDPLASTLGVAADFVETGEHMTESQRDKSAMLVTAAIIKNLSNKVWLSGITDIAQAIDDPDRYGSGFVSRIAGSIAVPAAVSQAARLVDPVLREAREPIDRIKSRIPGLSTTLMPKRDVWGEPIRTEGGVGPDVVSPMRTSTARNDRVTRELLSIEASIGKVPRKVGGRELTPQEYDRYQEGAGRNIRATLVELVGSDHWLQLTTEEKKEAVEKAGRDGRTAARESLF